MILYALSGVLVAVGFLGAIWFGCSLMDRIYDRLDTRTRRAQDTVRPGCSTGPAGRPQPLRGAP